jgi:superfamily II DNA or RNA helicase
MKTTIKLRDYQIKALSQVKLGEVNVLAICPGGGKTITATEYATNSTFKKVLILAHGTNVLKTQWNDELALRGIEYSNDIKDDVKFVVTIPQALIGIKKLPKFDLIIVDEAHEFYLADNMVADIIKKCKPKTQLLLTGTPSKFIAKGFTPIIISGVEVYQAGFLADPYLGCVSSAYSLDMDEFDTESGEVKQTVKETPKSVKKSFEQLIHDMLARLSEAGMLKDKPNLSGVSKAVGAKRLANYLFGKLEKTMISARSIEQANLISQILTKLGVNSVISTSEDDTDSDNIRIFKEDSKVKVLIVCRRGILGFNYPELVNVVDFTGSRNIDRIYQLYARSLRQFEGKNKFFFKLCYGVNRDVDAAFLQAALCLNNPDFISKYNGRNLKEMEVLTLKSPVVKTEDSEVSESTGGKAKSALVDKDMMMQVLRLGLMSDLTVNNQSDYWAEYKWAKFGAVIEKLTGQKFERTIKMITEENLTYMIETGEVDERIYG